MFDISGTELVIAQDALIDFETLPAADPSLSVRLRATDPVDPSLFVENDFSLLVGDTNDAPSDLMLSSESIDETTADFASIATLTSVDQDPSDLNLHQYSLVEGAGDTDNDLFYVDQDLNALRIKQAPQLAPQASYIVRLSTTDDEGGAFEKPFPWKLLIRPLPVYDFR